nr:hypothetical protein B0A51_09758 [Rachicladosporium sp. CCFEE 5018]
MRLYNVTRKYFKWFPGQVPSYAIASHRWLKAADEPTHKDLLLGCNTGKPGYRKFLGFVEHVRSHYRDIEWLWIDTCCINKSDEVEHYDALNSMYDWYSAATVCLAYLAEVPSILDDRALLRQSLSRSDWFTRRWTLQELVAPTYVVFLSRDWIEIGCKGAGRSRGALGPVDKIISRVTEIPVKVLKDPEGLGSVGAQTIVRWAEDRKSSHEGDLWYCLCGLLGAWVDARIGHGETELRNRLLQRLEQTGSFCLGDAAKIARELDRADQKARRQRAVPRDWQSAPAAAIGTSSVDDRRTRQLYTADSHSGNASLRDRRDFLADGDDAADENGDDEDDDGDDGESEEEDVEEDGSASTQAVFNEALRRVYQTLRTKGYPDQEARAEVEILRTSSRITPASRKPERSARAASAAARPSDASRMPRVMPISHRSDRVTAKEQKRPPELCLQPPRLCTKDNHRDRRQYLAGRVRVTCNALW